MKKVISFMALVALLLVCTGGPVAEDSLPGPPPPVKWQQRPDMAGGAVIASTLATPPALTAAEDWLCFDGSAVSDLHFWGAYAGWQDQTIEPSLPPPGIERFRLRIFSDSPATYPGSFSRPDKLLYESWVDNFNESYIDTIALPDGRFEHVYRYDLGLPRLFFQRPDRIYWLNIAAEPLDAAYDWGWETSIDHWNDVAVEGWYENFDSWFWSPVTHPFSLEPVNMSFAMTGCGGPFKWLQLPDLSDGRNIASYPDDSVVADDWLCTDGKPVEEVVFWGSFVDQSGGHWQQRSPQPTEAPPVMQEYILSFYADIPAGVDPQMPWSHPGEMLRQVVVPGEEVQARYFASIPHESPFDDDPWWEHKFYFSVQLGEPFEQNEGVAYWMDIRALPASNSPWLFGWETSAEHWNDHAVRGDGTNWEDLGRIRADFEDLTLETTYTVGDSIPTDGTVVTVAPFQWTGGTWYSGGYARVEDLGKSGGSGNEILVNNVNLDIDLHGAAPQLVLLFGEYGGNLNMLVNGEFLNFYDFADIDGATIGGAVAAVSGGGGNDTGTLSLIGPVRRFAVGGQELFIDSVEADAAVDMAFALITEADTSFCEADYSRDGDVDGADLATAIADFGRSDCFAAGDCEADHNYDGAVEETDLADLAPDFGRSNCPCALP